MKQVVAFLLLLFPLTVYSFTAAVTLSPYAKILSKIAGDRISVVTLVPNGADPHTFEPKPSTLQDFSRASIYFTDGSGLDKNWLPRFKGVHSTIKIVSLDEGIQWKKEKTVHSHGSHSQETLDPHLWTSPKNVKIIASNMLNVLLELDSVGRNLYKKNYELYLKELDLLSKEIETLAKSLSEKEKTFMVFHPSFGYFARDYGFKQLCIESEGKEPKPRDLQHLIQEAKAANVKTVFVMPNFSRRAAETIAKSIQGNVEVIDPLAYEFESSLRILLQTLKRNAK